MLVNLSPRLFAAAHFVPQGAHVIDVGTDHARLPVYLAQTGRAAHVWACDIRSGPLRGASALVERTHTGEAVELRLTDGLHGFGPADADTVVITGMGGETIASVLADAPWLRESGTLLILSPHTKQAHLRRFLTDGGFSITAETLAEDAGRIYPIFTARAGAVCPSYTEAELHTGRYAQLADEPLFPRYLASVTERARRAAAYDAAAAALLTELETMKARLIHDNSRTGAGAALPPRADGDKAGF